MHMTSARNLPSLQTRVANLRRRHLDLAARIEDELQRPAPCSMSLQDLKRRRLSLKDQIARHETVMRNPNGAQFPLGAA
ncbi:hypothetical protein PARPLA_03118 [Rhodobacteraceae bacterium THAF1]|uniref:YdcH family protein n=1 Tax=Palleronia sp. THAF1 TaxID=2587842 RepID=UPI000F3F70B0|nr:YdcH family protein [Palleronia sp. THAF1]QFU08735.1 hypothetical protein FIU81_08620 [Palleronia sp. THAF1]VDC30528.1 hypothetical protein PARPLA_03118 [Rhodobacteraceae bacterium THAF1]